MPWSGPENIDGPGHRTDGPIKLTARLSAVPPSLRPTALANIDADAPVSATIGPGAHQRVAWTQRPGTSWKSAVKGTPCDAFDDAECVQLSTVIAGVMQQGDRVRADIVSEDAAARAQEFFERPVGRGPTLPGDIVAEWVGLHEALGHALPAAIERGDFALTVGDPTRARARWILTESPSAETSTDAAPSWAALCDGAQACFRTGPWPDLGGWLASQPPGTLDSSAPRSLLATGASEWPHVMSGLIVAARARLPPAAQGFFDQALTGLGDIVCAGGRVDDDGSIAFVRVPAQWVNFTASALAYAGYPAPPHRLEDGTEVSWAPLPTGGIVMALDDEPKPTMGWIVFATSPERFAWLQRLPKTQAGPSFAAAQIARLSDVLAFAPTALRRALADHREHALTVQLSGEDGFLVATAKLAEKVR